MTKKNIGTDYVRREEGITPDNTGTGVYGSAVRYRLSSQAYKDIKAYVLSPDNFKDVLKEVKRKKTQSPIGLLSFIEQRLDKIKNLKKLELIVSLCEERKMIKAIKEVMR